MQEPKELHGNGKPNDKKSILHKISSSVNLHLNVFLWESEAKPTFTASPALWDAMAPVSFFVDLGFVCVPFQFKDYYYYYYDYYDY